MKNILLTMAFLAISLAVSAQFEAGNIFVTGSLGFGSGNSESTIGSTTSEGPKTSNFMFRPAAGYFLNQNIAVGLGFGTESERTVRKGFNNLELEDKISMLEFFIFMRYYMACSGRFGWFAQPRIGFGSGKEIEEDQIGQSNNKTRTEVDLSSTNFGIDAGLYYMFTNRVLAEFMFGVLGVSNSKREYTNPDTQVKSEFKSSDFSFMLQNFIPQIGFVYFLNRAKE